MKNLLLATVVVLGLSTGVALAGDGNQDAFAFQSPGVTTVISPTYKRLPSTIGTPFPFYIAGQTVPDPVTAAVLPMNGSESVLQTVGSLPKGFENGTVALTQAQHEQRYAVAHEAAQEAAAQRAATLQAAAQHNAAPAARING